MMVTKHHVSAERSEMAKKRTNGEGTIRQRGTGLWECTIMDGFQPNGKRKYKSFYGSTQGEVKKKMKAYLKAKEEGSLAAQDYTFGEWQRSGLITTRKISTPPPRRAIATPCGFCKGISADGR